MTCKALICSLAVGLMALRFADVHASSVEVVLTSQSFLVQQSGADMIFFASPGAGELFVTLTDLDFPAPFTSLQYGLDDAAGLKTGMSNAGVETTETLSGATTFEADIFSVLGSNASAGLYNFTATFLPAGAATVPLPASGISMIGGLMLLLGASRRQRSFRLQ
jgi:hypothetical protein